MNKILLSFGVVGVLAYCVPAMPTNAISILNSGNSIVQPYTEGLICSYELTISKYNSKLCLNVKTSSNDIMKSIGITNIKVQYSSDGVNWATEKTLSDMLKSSASEYLLNNYSVSIKGGYYYRISCTHYAKEKGLFGSSQSVENTSKSVWID